MRTENSASSKASAIAQWEVLLRDEGALLACPDPLVTKANALHRPEVINSDDLSDLLEQADGALAYAMEAMIDAKTAL